MRMESESLAKASIPAEFLPRNDSAISGKEEDDNLSNLFREGDEDNDTKESLFTEVSIGPNLTTFRVRLPPNKNALFAHEIWSGSKFLCDYILENPDWVCNKSTIELGAGTALPSLAALRNGSRLSFITDYPDPDLLQAIRETVGFNWNLGWTDRVVVRGHEWGTSVESLLCCSSPWGGEKFFDVAFLSECLWNHACHPQLARSLDQLLHPQRGVAFVTYAHHIPGLETRDDHFFTWCQQHYGFRSFWIGEKLLPYMWDPNKSITVYLVKMVRGSMGDPNS